MGKDWDKSHNIYCLLDAHYTDNTPFKVIAKFLRESKIHKALTDKTEVYESHVRRFWSSVRYEEKEKMIYSTVRKKDENDQDIDVEIKFNVGDLRRVLELDDSDSDPIIIPERLCKGLWCRMGFSGNLNGKMLKTVFSKPYKFMIHCVVHALAHRKGAYDETSDYIMNIITCLVLNRPYNVSQVIFDHLVDNVKAGSGKYIMYPRFIQMIIDDLVKDIPKDAHDILGLRNMTADTISRLSKGPDQRARRMICRIDNPAYVAPENDAWRHENSNSESEDNKMNEMIEKKLRYWFVKDGKRKRTPKTSPAEESTPKIVVKGPSKESQQRLVDEPVLELSEVLQQGADLLKHSLESFLKKNEEVSTQKDQSTSVQAESVKETDSEGVARDDSSDADAESAETETEIDMATLGRGKVQMKKKPQKKKKGSDDEDSTYTPLVEEKKKLCPAKSLDFHNKHNICCTLDKTLRNMSSFVEILKFIEDSRIHKALTDQHKCYESHVRAFWNSAHYVEDDKAIHSTVKMKDDNNKDIDVAVKITVEDIRRVLDLKDKDEDPIYIPERLCKGLWFRMGYTGSVNDQAYVKSKLSKPYKFLVHSVIHALGHRKGGYDESADYIMNIITCLILNRPYNISQMIFNHMLGNMNGERFLQYPRFVQMLLDDQIPNLPKIDDDELVLEHMDNETLKRLDVYEGIEKGKEPKFRKKFAAIEKSDYQAPADDKWRHDDSDSGSETEKMKLFEPKKTRWWVMKDDKKNPTPKAAPKKSPPHLIDDVPPENVNVAGDYVEISVDEFANIAATQEARDAAAKAGELKETKEKIKQVEAENVVLKNEMLAMNDQIEDVKAGNNALNEMIDELLTTNCELNDANTAISHANEIMQKEIEDLKADKENKSKQIEMLYAVIEDRLGINVHAAYDDIEIRRAEEATKKDKGKGIAVEEASEEVLESSSQREQQPDVVEVNDENPLVLAQQFVLVGKAKSESYYSREDNARRIEVERRRLKAKEANKASTVLMRLMQLQH
ncbi:hypothetical protein HanHA89_Chr14g0559441 [Helianthus annuus]|nr:hypothetical protein HanHA89_Chr14g0559441 [Helianthus annuus]